MHTPVRRIGTIRCRGPHRRRLRNRIHRFRNRVHRFRNRVHRFRNRVHRPRNTSNIRRLTAPPRRPSRIGFTSCPSTLVIEDTATTTLTDSEPAVMPASLRADRQAVLTDIGRRLDRLSVGPVHRRVVVAIGLGLFFEVYEIFLSSNIATALSTQYGVGGTSLELLLASTFFGMFVGAAVFGRIADRVGRRRAFLLNLVWFRCGAWWPPSRPIRGF
jgi:hypothetical protein